MKRLDPHWPFDDMDFPSDDDLDIDVSDEQLTAYLREDRRQAEWINAAERALQNTTSHPFDDWSSFMI